LPHSIYRHDGRRGLGGGQGRGIVALRRPPPARDLLGHVRRLADAAHPAMSCTVKIASPLRSYTSGAATVTAAGATVADVLADLDRRFPGMRFRMIDEQDRIRPHIRLYAGKREIRELAEPVGDERVVHLICALSG